MGFLCEIKGILNLYVYYDSPGELGLRVKRRTPSLHEQPSQSDPR